jgi:YHS domain-containing protein
MSAIQLCFSIWMLAEMSGWHSISFSMVFMKAQAAWPMTSILCDRSSKDKPKPPIPFFIILLVHCNPKSWASERDPVCGMMVGSEDRTAMAHAQTFRFCSEWCRDQFLRQPKKYVSAEDVA